MIYLRAGVNPWLPWGVFLCLLFVFGVTKCKSDSLSRMFHFFFFICCSVILRRNKQFKSLTWLAGSGVSIFCCKKFVDWAFELWLGGLLQAEWRIKIDEPYWQTWYILVLFHGIPYGFFFFWTFAGYVYCERPEPTLSWYVWQFSMKLPQGKK